MKIAIFVHEFERESGHSNAMIEVLNHLPESFVTELVIVSYRCSKLSEILPTLSQRARFVAVPFPGIWPFFLRAVFYHFYAWLWSCFCLSKDFFKIGIGIASMNVDLSNVQFVHHQWSSEYLKMLPFPSLRYLYKWVLHRYLCLMESFFLRVENS